ncbi:unnamed protein product [Paramecium primaurelia]|uniref:Transmembrane protein n=1 Tax=Paramecium primaurelia TaxID=5886 RepID=A0A8S1K7I3_PARPR|nr:unnamed protein product [Paramecium primaurelia]
MSILLFQWLINAIQILIQWENQKLHRSQFKIIARNLEIKIRTKFSQNLELNCFNIKEYFIIIKVALLDPLFIECLPIIFYNLQEQQEDLEMLIYHKKEQQQIKREQTHIIQSKVIRINKRHQTDKI